MSDQNKFINTYVDKAVGMLHEYIGMVIQLRTQLHIANDLIQEKDQVISSLQQQIDQNKSDQTELDTAKQSARNWEDNYNAMKVKIGHMDTLTAQLNETKNLLLARTQEVESLTRTVDELKNPAPKKVINTKKQKSVAPVVTETPTETDDF